MSLLHLQRSLHLHVGSTRIQQPRLGAEGSPRFEQIQGRPAELVLPAAPLSLRHSNHRALGGSPLASIPKHFSRRRGELRSFWPILWNRRLHIGLPGGLEFDLWMVPCRRFLRDHSRRAHGCIWVCDGETTLQGRNAAGCQQQRSHLGGLSCRWQDRARGSAVPAYQMGGRASWILGWRGGWPLCVFGQGAGDAAAE